MKYTDKLNLRKPEGGEYYSVEDFNGNADLIDAAITGKINKPAEYVAGNFAAVSASGNIEDSGRKPTDFAVSAHNHDTAYASVSHVSDKEVHVSADEKAAITAVTSKADRAYVDAALSNKATGDSAGNALNSNRFGKMDEIMFFRSRGEHSGHVNNCVIPGGYLIRDGRNQGLSFDGWGTLTVFAGGTGAILQEAVTQSGSSKYYRHFNGVTWSSWVSVATSVQPQEFDLPLTAGIMDVSNSCYCKTQDNMVTVSIVAKKEDGSVLNSASVIANLPIGYRPAKTKMFPCVTSNSSGVTNSSCHLYVTPEGTLCLYHGGNAYAVIANFTYKAN